MRPKGAANHFRVTSDQDYLYFRSLNQQSKLQRRSVSNKHKGFSQQNKDEEIQEIEKKQKFYGSYYKQCIKMITYPTFTERRILNPNSLQREQKPFQLPISFKPKKTFFIDEKILNNKTNNSTQISTTSRGNLNSYRFKALQIEEMNKQTYIFQQQLDQTSTQLNSFRRKIIFSNMNLKIKTQGQEESYKDSKSSLSVFKNVSLSRLAYKS